MSNPIVADTDGDGFLDGSDAFPVDKGEWLDSDHDGVGNNVDLDDDNDGVSDLKELELNTDPLNPHDDSDGDGFTNIEEKLQGTDPLNAQDIPSSISSWIGILLNKDKN